MRNKTIHLLLTVFVLSCSVCCKDKSRVPSDSKQDKAEDTVPKSVSVPVKKEHSLKTLLVLQITITNNKIQRLCYYQRNSFLP